METESPGASLEQGCRPADPVVGRMFPILGANAFVPWDFVQPHESWALKNHDQTVKRLADRGGLSWCELCAIIEHRKWQAMDPVSAHPTKAVARVLGHLIAWYDSRLAAASREATTPPSQVGTPSSETLSR